MTCSNRVRFGRYFQLSNYGTFARVQITVYIVRRVFIFIRRELSQNRREVLQGGGNFQPRYADASTDVGHVLSGVLFQALFSPAAVHPRGCWTRSDTCSYRCFPNTRYGSARTGIRPSHGACDSPPPNDFHDRSLIPFGGRAESDPLRNRNAPVQCASGRSCLVLASDSADQYRNSAPRLIPW